MLFQFARSADDIVEQSHGKFVSSHQRGSSFVAKSLSDFVDASAGLEFFFAIDIMLHGSFENINKATEIARKVEDEHSLKLARTVEHHDMNISNTRHDGIDVCLLRMNLMFEESFLHFNEFSRNLFI